MRNPNPQMEQRLARLVAGLSPYHETAIRRALGRVGALMIGDDAVVHPTVLGYDLTASSGGTVSSAFDVPGLFIGCAWHARAQFASASDDPALLRLSLTRQTGAPYLGDSRQGVSLKLLSELQAWTPLPVPWVVLPQDGTLWRLVAETLVGATRVSIGVSGFCVYGVGSGG